MTLAVVLYLAQPCKESAVKLAHWDACLAKLHVRILPSMAGLSSVIDLYSNVRSARTRLLERQFTGPHIGGRVMEASATDESEYSSTVGSVETTSPNETVQAEVLHATALFSRIDSMDSATARPCMSKGSLFGAEPASFAPVVIYTQMALL